MNKKSKKDNDMDDIDSSDNEMEDENDAYQVEAAKAAAFFESYKDTTSLSNSSMNNRTNCNNLSCSMDAGTNSIDSFTQLSFCGPILLGIAQMEYVQPTLIQEAALPLALAGCCAVVDYNRFNFLIRQKL